MNNIVKILTNGMDTKVIQAIQRRIDALMRGIRFEKQRDSSHYDRVRKLGWNLKKLEVICSLNAFYQIVIGPLASTTKKDVGSGLLTDHFIKYGNQLKLSSKEIERIGECHEEFKEIAYYHGVDIYCLQANHAQDILYRLANQGDLNG